MDNRKYDTMDPTTKKNLFVKIDLNTINMKSERLFQERQCSKTSAYSAQQVIIIIPSSWFVYNFIRMYILFRFIPYHFSHF